MYTITTLTLLNAGVGSNPTSDTIKYYVLVGGKRDKHMVEHEHFNQQQRAVQYYADIRNI